MYNENQIISKWISDMYDYDQTDLSDVEFALTVIGKAPKHILEIACGSGRILVPLAKAGHIVTGLDFDECMLNKISDKAKGIQGISWEKSDVIKDDWGHGYDVVMLAGNFLFNIVADMDYDKAQALVIKKVADALVSGGHLYIDYNYTLHPETWFCRADDNIVWQGSDRNGNTGTMVLHANTFDRNTQLVKFVRRFELTLADGSKIKQEIPSVKHFATLKQIHSWLESSGFILEEEYGDYHRNPIGETTDKAIIWARKR